MIHTDEEQPAREQARVGRDRRLLYAFDALAFRVGKRWSLPKRRQAEVLEIHLADIDTQADDTGDQHTGETEDASQNKGDPPADPARPASIGSLDAGRGVRR